VLDKRGRGDVVALLLEVVATVSTKLRGGDLILRLQVPLGRVDAFAPSIIATILAEAKPLFRTAGMLLADVEVVPLFEAPPDESDPFPGPVYKPERAMQHDGLWFRSKTEIKVYEALRKREVFFFVNASAVLGGGPSARAGKPYIREPDFLVCQDGKWGILEVMGAHVHTATNAQSDHERAREMKAYGVVLVEFYDASACYSQPDKVVKQFLALLAKTT